MDRYKLNSSLQSFLPHFQNTVINFLDIFWVDLLEYPLGVFFARISQILITFKYMEAIFSVLNSIVIHQCCSSLYAAKSQHLLFTYFSKSNARHIPSITSVCLDVPVGSALHGGRCFTFRNQEHCYCCPVVLRYDTTFASFPPPHWLHKPTGTNHNSQIKTVCISVSVISQDTS